MTSALIFAIGIVVRPSAVYLVLADSRISWIQRAAVPLTRHRGQCGPYCLGKQRGRSLMPMFGALVSRNGRISSEVRDWVILQVSRVWVGEDIFVTCCSTILKLPVHVSGTVDDCSHSAGQGISSEIMTAAFHFNTDTQRTINKPQLRAVVAKKTLMR